MFGQPALIQRISIIIKLSKIFCIIDGRYVPAQVFRNIFHIPSSFVPQKAKKNKIVEESCHELEWCERGDVEVHA